MCGIVGVFDLVGRRRTPSCLLEAMRDTMVHRGPDGHGARHQPGYALGHRRLSIIDLDGGAQPMSNGRRTAWVVANGEIYNHGALRRQLRAAGHRFRTESDCEVLGHAHDLWGDDAVHRLEGMFAYALVDETRHRLLLARDRLGIKPLVYCRVEDQLLFASEPKALLAHPAVDARLDTRAILGTLEYRYPVGDQTLFAGIRSLPPGHVLIAERGTVTVRPYWSIPTDTLDVGPDDATRLVRDALEQAVASHRVADVPVAAFLSGGLDSSAIVGLMSQAAANPVATFTTGFADGVEDERAHARTVANRWGTEHREVVLGASDYAAQIGVLIRKKDAPLGVPNEVPLWQMSRALRDRATVVLCGEGADELFGGYGRLMRAADDYDRHHAGGSVAFAEAFRARYGERTFATPADLFLARYRYFGDAGLESTLDPDVLAAGRADDPATDAIRATFDRVRDLPTARQYLHVMQRHHLPGLLGRLDASTMAASIEGRVPFADRALVELGQRLPTSLRMRWRSAEARAASRDLVADDISETHDEPKWVLKRATRELVPEAIRARRKVGFPLPLGRWLAGGLGDHAREVLLDPATARRGLIRPAGVERLLARGAHGGASWHDGMQVFLLLGLELFCRHLDGAPAVRASAA